MKNLCLLFICYLLLIDGVCAQIMDLKLNSKVAELRKARIDTIITYYTYCNGGFVRPIAPDDTITCHTYESKYLVWMDNGINYIQKFNQCYNYNDIKKKGSEITNFLKFHFALLKSESIKGIMFRKKINGKHQLFSSSIDHSCFANFEFYIGAKKAVKKIN